MFDQISEDSVAVVLDPDTILLTPAGFDHLDATVFNTSLSSLGTAVIYPSWLNGSDTVTVVFPHVQVPQNFQVGLVPSKLTSGFTASYSTWLYTRSDPQERPTIVVPHLLVSTQVQTTTKAA